MYTVSFPCTPSYPIQDQHTLDACQRTHFLVHVHRFFSLHTFLSDPRSAHAGRLSTHTFLGPCTPFLFLAHLLIRSKISTRWTLVNAHISWSMYTVSFPCTPSYPIQDQHTLDACQ